MNWKKIWTVKYSFVFHLFPSLGLFDKAYIPSHFFAFLSFFLYFFFHTVSTTSVIIPALISNLFEALLLAAQHIKFDANLVRRRYVLHQMIDAFFQGEKKFAATREHG